MLFEKRGTNPNERPLNTVFFVPNGPFVQEGSQGGDADEYTLQNRIMLEELAEKVLKSRAFNPIVVGAAYNFSVPRNVIKRLAKGSSVIAYDLSRRFSSCSVSFWGGNYKEEANGIRYYEVELNLDYTTFDGERRSVFLGLFEIAEGDNNYGIRPSKNQPSEAFDNQTLEGGTYTTSISSSEITTGSRKRQSPKIYFLISVLQFSFLCYTSGVGDVCPPKGGVDVGPVG